MLGVARRLAGTGVPLLGINLGRVGFLAEVPAGEWAATLERLLAAPLRVERRLALRFGVERGGVEIFQGDAVNDVVINRGALARVITLDIDVDGERLAGLRADGLIIPSIYTTEHHSVCHLQRLKDTIKNYQFVGSQFLPE